MYLFIHVLISKVVFLNNAGIYVLSRVVLHSYVSVFIIVEIIQICSATYTNNGWMDIDRLVHKNT